MVGVARLIAHRFWADASAFLIGIYSISKLEGSVKGFLDPNPGMPGKSRSPLFRKTADQGDFGEKRAGLRSEKIGHGWLAPRSWPNLQLPIRERAGAGGAKD
jgi:hypothetical protein